MASLISISPVPQSHRVEKNRFLTDCRFTRNETTGKFYL